MLAYNINGENPVSYSELLLAAWKLERWVEARDPLLPKTPTAGSSTITHSHSWGNLFPSRKLKGSHTFTAQPAAVEDHEIEEDSGPKHNGDKEAESSAEEDTLLSYIMWFTNAVKLYQKKKKELQLLWVWQPRSLSGRLPKGSGENHKEGRYKLERGDGKEGRQVLSEAGGSTGHPR